MAPIDNATRQLLDNVKQEPLASDEPALKRMKSDADSRDRESSKDGQGAPKSDLPAAAPTKEDATKKLVARLAAAESNMANILTDSNQTPAERKLRRKRFDRSLEPCSLRQCRTQKIPTSIALKLQNMALKDRAEGRRYFFNLWLNSDEDWAKVEISERIINAKSNRKYGKIKWVMLHDLENMYPPVICKAIWDAKLADPTMWRPHPDIPEVQEAIQIKLPVEEGEEWDEEDKHISETNLTADMSKEAGKTLLPSRIGNSPVQPSVSSLSPTAPTAATSAEAPRGVDKVAAPEDRDDAGAADQVAAKYTQEIQISPAEAAIRDREAAKIAALKKKMAEMETRRSKKEAESETKRREAEAEREAKKEAAEARKNTVEGKAEKWALGISKELAAGKGEIKDAKSAKTKDSKTTALIKLVEEHCKALEQMREKLEKAGIGDKVKEDVIRKAPDALK